MEADGILDQIGRLEQSRLDVTEAVRIGVEKARLENHNWQEIAEALQISRSSAMSRYVGKVAHVDLRARPDRGCGLE